MVDEIKTDVLIIGCEAAGARTAIEIADHGVDVLVVTKGLFGRSGNTVMAGGGIQAALGHTDPRDNPDVHMEDVVKGGAYLNNQKLVERLVNLAPAEIIKLNKWGVKFRKVGDDRFYQLPAPGSTYPRMLYFEGGHGGIQLRRGFKSQLERLKVKVMEEVYISRVLLSDGEVSGAFGLSMRDGRFILFKAKTIILATGGCTKIYRENDGSPEATGDSMSMAYEIGAEVMDMEFQQFFPLCCYWPTAYRMNTFTADFRYLLRGTFYNSEGEAFMERYFPMAREGGLRDPTSRAIYLENLAGRGSPHGGAYLSITHLPENLINAWIAQRKPPVVAKLQKMGIDIRRQAVEVGPGCHYSMGGIRVNENCETSLPRLYAVGEAAAGMDGAERIDGGPALTWCVTMGCIAGQEAARKIKELDWLKVDPEQVKREEARINGLWKRKTGVKGFEIKKKIGETMWENCSLVKRKEGLEKSLRIIEEIRNEELSNLCVPGPSRIFNKGWTEALEAIGMTKVAEMIIRSALMRDESRQSHYRTDFPKRDDVNWIKNIVAKKEGERMVLTAVPPVMTKIRPPEREREG